MVDYKERCSYLERRIKELQENPISRKEDIITKIAKEFGEDSHEKKSYQDGDVTKTYNSMTNFSSGLYAMKKEMLSELLDKICILKKKFANAKKGDGQGGKN